MAGSSDARIARPGADAPIDRLLQPLRWFGGFSAAGGITLLVAAAAAMIWANSGSAASYFNLWQGTNVSVTFGGGTLNGSVAYWINDLLMAVFFLLVGLEIKRELAVGELASFSRAATPIAAAIGGMVVPAGIYAAFNAGTPAIRGWGVPMATDIAFALGVLAVFGKRAPLSMRVFLASLAIIDDLGALLVIAVFYTDMLNYQALGIALGLVAVLGAGNLAGIRAAPFYLLVGLVMWHFMHASGVHATIAGVLVAVTIPRRQRVDADDFIVHAREMIDEFERAGEKGHAVITNPRRQAALASLEMTVHDVNAPLTLMEHRLATPVTFLILPLFALANAGVAIMGGEGAPAVHWDRSAWGIALGLVIGKPVGIVLATLLAVRLRLGSVSPDLTTPRLVALGFLGGIGFTMALFIAHLAFKDAGDLATAKVAVLAASVVSAVAGTAIMLVYKGPAPRA